MDIIIVNISCVILGFISLQELALAYGNKWLLRPS